LKLKNATAAVSWIGTRTTKNSPQHPSPFSTTDADAFQDISAAQQDQIFADFATTALTREQAVTGGTYEDKSRAWARWEEYCLSIGCQDIFMDSFSKQEQMLLLRAFAMAVRSGRFSDA
jgi:hypothetical protein